ncbi:hypothetical protein GCK32_014415, partial [Trichostrongylus colubriformis]
NFIFKMTRRLWILVTYLIYAAKCDILETSGFHCKNAKSMRLDRSLHGSPHMTVPPFEFSITDGDGNAIEYYEPGETYRVLWTTDRDIGAVQFLLTVAAEDELYWERWRPRTGFIRPKWARDIPIVDSLFKIEVLPGPEEPTLSPDEEASTFSPDELSTSEPFDPKIFEEIEAAEEIAVKQIKSGEALIALSSAITPITVISDLSIASTSTTAASHDETTGYPETTTTKNNETVKNSKSTTIRAVELITGTPPSVQVTAQYITMLLLYRLNSDNQTPTVQVSLRSQDWKW